MSRSALRESLVFDSTLLAIGLVLDILCLTIKGLVKVRVSLACCITYFGGLVVVFSNKFGFTSQVCIRLSLAATSPSFVFLGYF